MRNRGLGVAFLIAAVGLAVGCPLGHEDVEHPIVGEWSLTKTYGDGRAARTTLYSFGRAGSFYRVYPPSFDAQDIWAGWRARRDESVVTRRLVHVTISGCYIDVITEVHLLEYERLSLTVDSDTLTGTGAETTGLLVPWESETREFEVHGERLGGEDQ